MSDGSAIEWTDASWNPVRGCDKVSAGCKNCYAETFAERWRGIKGHPFERGFDLRLVPEALDKPLRWRRARKIFVNSMSDLFHEDIPNEYIAAVFGVMAACPLHTFQVLTKRAARMQQWFEWMEKRSSDALSFPVGLCAALASQWLKRPADFMPDLVAEWPRWPLPNVHLGVSTENQETADERIPLLLQCPAAVRWVSAEPLLGPTSLADLHDGAGGIIKPLVGLHWEPTPKGLTVRKPRGAALDWVVVGGESGSGARPCDLAWIRSIVEQCKAASVPVFCKQLGSNPTEGYRDQLNYGPMIMLKSRKGGEPSEWPDGDWPRQFPRSAP